MSIGLLFHIIIFSTVQLIGIFTAKRVLLQRVVPIQEFSMVSAMFSFILAIVLVFVLLKFAKRMNLFKYLFYFLIIIGSKLVFSAFLPNLAASTLSILLLITFIVRKSLLVHNVVLALTIAGVSVSLGLSFGVGTVLFLLGAFSLYDVIAVYRSKHMVSMFKNMVGQGVIMAVLVPKTIGNINSGSRTFKPGAGLFVLGSGDLAFPLLFAVSVMKVSVLASWFVFAGALVGATLVYYLLATQSEPRAMPALPPIAVCSLLGFLLSFLV